MSESKKEIKWSFSVWIYYPNLLIPGCPLNWTEFKNSCYWLSDTTLSWADANTHCQQENSNLASILSAEEDEFLVAEFVTDDRNFIWLGGHEENDVEGAWVWTDGAPFSCYTDWRQGQPDNLNGNEDCLCLMDSRYDGQFNDIDCTQKKKFLCKKWRGAIIACCCLSCIIITPGCIQ